MPAFSTHYIFAKEMTDRIKEIADFEVNENALLIGAQGPDIFFFHRAFPWQIGKTLRKLGSALHREKPSVLLDRLYEYCKKSNNADIAKSYAFGFILHYALDRNCHPFVYYLQNRITNKIHGFNPHSAHNIIEHSLDSIMLNTRLNIARPVLFETEGTLDFTPAELSETARAIAFTADIYYEDALTAVKDMKSTQKLLLDRNGRKKQIISKLEKIASPFTNNFLLSSYFRTDDLENAKKYVNINKANWKSPFDSTVCNRNFFELYELAKDDAEKMLINWQSGVDGKTNTNNLSFLTGVEVK